MIITVAAFTEKGNEIYNKLSENLPKVLFRMRSKDEALSDWARDAFVKHIPLVFVGAAGIAVRTIAPFVQDKLYDSPVIVIDEKGEFVIPILSGHVGAANEISLDIARALKATPVLTTATDVENIFSVDVFARRNYMNIENREGIRSFSSKLLQNERAGLYIRNISDLDKNLIPKNVEIVLNEDLADIVLEPKKYVLGMGCKKGKSFDELKAFVLNNLEKNEIDIRDIAAVTSIDLKEKEEGLNVLSAFLHVPFITYTSEQLLNLDKSLGEDYFSKSEFVKNVTGVSNVCERAAMSFDRSKALYIKKTAQDGMTFAVAKLEGRITSWET